MLYMMEWSIMSGAYDQCHDRFLKGAAPMPDGSTLLGRWHAPSSGNGWLLVETDDPGTVYVHGAEWGDFVSWKITPVFTDDQAAAVSGEGRGRRPA